MIELTTLQAVREVVTIVGVITGLSYYIITVRNQNRARQIQIFRGVDTISEEVDFLYYEFGDYDDFMSKYGPESNPEGWKNTMGWFRKLEEFGVYVKEGFLDIRLIYLLQGGNITKSWELLKVLSKEQRIQRNMPRWFIEAEYLCKKIVEYGEKHPELKT